MKYSKRKGELCGIVVGIMMFFLTVGCGREPEELETEIFGKIGAVLPEGEALEELRLKERERTRETVRYHVYCRVCNDADGTSCEKCYLVTFRRVGGKWICDGEKDVQFMEERK